MTTAQPGQEQRMELKQCPFCDGEAMPCEGDAGNFSPYVECEDCEAAVARGTLAEAMTAWNTRPTADLGEDGELVAKLRNLRVVLKSGDYDGADLMSAWCTMRQAADRLILYREALEAAYREGWIDGYHNGRGGSVIDPTPDWLESDARAVLRSGG